MFTDSASNNHKHSQPRARFRRSTDATTKRDAHLNDAFVVPEKHIDLPTHRSHTAAAAAAAAADSILLTRDVEEEAERLRGIVA